MYHRRPQIGHRPASRALPPVHGSPRLQDDELNALSTYWQMSPTVPQRPGPLLTLRRRIPRRIDVRQNRFGRRVCFANPSLVIA